MRRPITILLAALLFAACTEKKTALIGTQAEGQPCTQVSDCKPGLDCQGGSCTPFPASAVSHEGQACSASTSCGDGLCCGNQSACRPIADNFSAGHCGLLAGEPCGLSPDCDVGLICNGSGKCSTPTGAGSADVGQACMVFEDCRRPLLCANHSCVQIPFYPGVSCHRSEEEIGAFRMYFEVPRGQPLDEFYRQPFPSDVRRKNGHIDLSGHPSPGAVAGVDFTKLYLDALAEDSSGFGLSSPVFMTFSDQVDPSTLAINSSTATVRLVDITKTSPSYKQTIEIQRVYKRDKGQFICTNSLAVAPIDGHALRPNTTYAVIVASSIKSLRGENPIHDGDFETLLAPTAPAGDSFLVDAYAAYAPLRAYLSDQSIAPAAIAGAAVFTTQDPGAIAKKIHDAVRAAPAPTMKNITRCDSGVVSPCAVPGMMRDCPAAAARFHQLHLKVSNPMIQRGTRPYAVPGPDGHQGAIAFDAEGKVVVQGSEDLCVSLSIPKTGPMPAGGWPILLYAHGTGGDFLSAMQGLADDLAEVKDAQGHVLSRVAVLGYDNVMHGPRQGTPPAEWKDPGNLFFNVASPRAARDNVLQGAADLFNLLRLAQSAQLSSAQTGIAGAPVKFDPGRVMMYGHSQGTVVAPAFLAAEPELRAAVLTGAGAEIGLSLVEKKKPNDVASLTRTIFADQSLTRLHPVIGLMSFFFNAADAIPYGGAFDLAPPAGRHPLDYLHVYGVDDGYVPESAQRALVRNVGEPIVGTVLRPISGGVDTVAGPVHANLNGASAGSIQYQPTRTGGALDYDGHFVGSHDPAAKAAIYRFLATAATSTRGQAVIQR